MFLNLCSYKSYNYFNVITFRKYTYICIVKGPLHILYTQLVHKQIEFGERKMHGVLIHRTEQYLMDVLQL